MLRRGGPWKALSGDGRTCSSFSEHRLSSCAQESLRNNMPREAVPPRSVAEIVLATMKRRTSASNVTSKASRCRGHRQPPLNDDMTSVALHCSAPSKITMGMLATGSNPHGPALPPWTFPPKACARTELGKKCGCARAESRARI